MKTSFSLAHASWALAALCLFGAGYFLGNERGPDGHAAPGGFGKAGAGNGGTAGQAEPEESGAAKGIRNSTAVLTPEQTRARVFQVLTEPNQVARMTEFCELLGHVTKDNWQEMMEAFVRQKSKEGRSFSVEWEMALQRAGEVAGVDALATVLASKDSRVQGWSNWLVLGWAGQDPQAALEWYKNQPPGRQAQLQEYLVRGMGRASPEVALAYSMTLSEDTVRDIVPKIVGAAIQRGGFRGAEELLTSIQGRPEVPEKVKNMVFVSLGQNKIQSGVSANEPARALEWAEPYLGQSYFGPYIMRDMVGAAAKANSTATLAWFDERNERLTPLQAEAAYSTVAQQWLTQAPNDFTAWMQAHPDHPQYDTMAQSLVNSLLQSGHADQARQWAGTMHNPTITIEGGTIQVPAEKITKGQ